MGTGLQYPVAYVQPDEAVDIKTAEAGRPWAGLGSIQRWPQMSLSPPAPIFVDSSLFWEFSLYFGGFSKLCHSAHNPGGQNSGPAQSVPDWHTSRRVAGKE